MTRPDTASPASGGDRRVAARRPLLVERARAGDAIAFELIMRRYNRRLFRLARSVLRNAAEAEDVVQETYVRAYARLGDFVGPHGFSTWLGRIAMNEALGRLRGRDRVVSLDDYVKWGEGQSDVRRVETLMAHQPDPERMAGDGELRRLLEQSIDRLPDEFRVVFVLRAVEGLSVAETAESLSILPQTVRTRFHRARRLLQEALGARFEALMPTAFEFGGERCDRIVATALRRLEPALQTARRRNST
jgi:RNA polymerase sigma-70 factor (ECF subfamily)